MRMRKVSAGVRMHFKRDGQAKVKLTANQAAANAARYAQVPYECEFCGAWHCGRPS